MLIVDDSRETLDGLAAYYRRKLEVLVARDVEEGMRLLRDGRIPVDIVLADLILPNVCGGCLIAWVKKSFPDLPVIAMTGWDPNGRISCAASDADCLLVKPFEMEDLDRRIEELLAARQETAQKRRTKASSNSATGSKVSE